jgi:hypothetical protein
MRAALLNLRDIPTLSQASGFFWALKIALQAGWLPEVGLYFNGGVGDEIMRTAVARELRIRGVGTIWQFASSPELYIGNQDFVTVPDDFRLHRLCAMFGSRRVEANYPTNPQKHCIAVMCEAAGITGEVELRPYVFISANERRRGYIGSRPQVAIQTSSLAARHPMANKLWPHDRFQRVADALSSEFDVIQVGMPSDPPLSGAIDVRGNTLRETAAIFSASVLFVGLATGLMHLARAVDCRGVIVYGGREHPSQTGYSANENICWNGPCSPCWLRNECAHDRVCMSDIGAETVITAARRQAQRYGTSLPVERVII